MVPPCSTGRGAPSPSHGLGPLGTGAPTGFLSPPENPWPNLYHPSHGPWLLCETLRVVSYSCWGSGAVIWCTPGRERHDGILQVKELVSSTYFYQHPKLAKAPSWGAAACPQLSSSTYPFLYRCLYRAGPPSHPHTPCVSMQAAPSPPQRNMCQRLPAGLQYRPTRLPPALELRVMLPTAPSGAPCARSGQAPCRAGRGPFHEPCPKFIWSRR